MAAAMLTACSGHVTADTHRVARPASSSTVVPPTDVRPRARLALIGDSLLFATTSTMLEDLVAADVVAVRAVPGLRSGDAISYLHDLDVARIDAFGISLGTNDAIDGASGDGLDAIDAFAASIRAAGCVRWMAIEDTTPDRRFNDAAGRVNAELRRLSAIYPNFDIVPWNMALSTHPEWLASDGIHHTTEGSVHYGQMLSGAIEACPNL